MRAKALAMLSTALFGLVVSLMTPWVSLRAQALGMSTQMIGWLAAMPALGIILFTMLIPKWVKRCSSGSLFAWAALGSGLTVLLFGVTEHLGFWLLLRFFSGGFGSILLVLGESYINQLAGAGSRGRLVAIYTTLFTLSQAIGPLVLARLGAAGWGALFVAAGVYGIAWLFSLGCRWDLAVSESDSFGQGRLSLWRFMSTIPVVVSGTFLFAFFDTTVLGLLPLYGLDHGLSAAKAALMISVVFAGDFCLQLPLGVLADRMRLKILYRSCAGLLFFCALILNSVVARHFWLGLILFIMGAAASGMYTLSLIWVGRRFCGHDLIVANAYIGLVWGLGALLGPLLSSAAMQSFGTAGLPWSLALLTLLFGLTTVRAR